MYLVCTRSKYGFCKFGIHRNKNNFEKFVNKKKLVMLTYVIKDNHAVCFYFRIYRRCKFPTFCSYIHTATVNVGNIEEYKNKDNIRKLPNCILILSKINDHLEEKLSDRK